MLRLEVERRVDADGGLTLGGLTGGMDLGSLGLGF